MVLVPAVMDIRQKISLCAVARGINGAQFTTFQSDGTELQQVYPVLLRDHLRELCDVWECQGLRIRDFRDPLP